MNTSKSTVLMRGVEVERLSCGCAPLRSSGRSRCAEAGELHAEVMRLQGECEAAKPGAERMNAMGRKARAYDEYRVHLGALPVSNVAVSL